MKKEDNFSIVLVPASSLDKGSSSNVLVAVCIKN